jgi:repressor LexA
MIKKITTKQRRVFNFYQSYIKENEQAPTYQEAAGKLDLSPSVVFTHVKNLEKGGYLATSSNERSVQILNQNLSIPLLGQIACGEPIYLYEECSEYINAPKTLLKGPGSFYALTAVGKSMIKAGIDSGDTLVIRKQNDVDDGDIAVIAIGDGFDGEKATLKKVYHRAETLLLKPENDDFPVAVVKNGQIRGKLVGVL